MNWKMWAVTVVVTVAIAAGCGLFFSSGTTDAPEPRDNGPETVTDDPAGELGPYLVDGEQAHLRNVRKLTSGGENAEAYWSWDGTQIIYQARSGDMPWDQIYIMDRDGSNKRMVSTGHGACTCAYFLVGDDRIVFSSTHGRSHEPPGRPDYSQGYVWALHEGYDVWTADTDGGNLVQLTDAPGYDAEATVGPDGRIVFTSVRDGDLDIYTMNPDGSDVTRLTDTPGYDGGPFFSPDGSKIVYRSHHPEGAELEDYRRLLAQNLIRPGALDVWVMNADGSGKTRLTDNGAANFAPYWHPSGEKILFVSNMHNPEGRDFDLYLIGIDGEGLERVTFNETFDGFPMFGRAPNRDGSWPLLFCSNRANDAEGETNVFLADWVD